MMGYAYSILMFIFAGVLALYGLLCIKAKDPNLLPFRGRKASKKRTADQVTAAGKTAMLTACAPLLSGIIGLFIPFESAPLAVLIPLAGGIAVAIIAGRKLFGRKKETNNRLERGMTDHEQHFS